MKKNVILYFASATALIAALVACSKVQPVNDAISQEEGGVTFHEVQIIASNASSEADTKAYIESDGASGFVSKWNDDDQIGLFQKNSVDGYRTKVTSKKTDISLTDSDKTASFSVTLAETDGANNYKYWAVYPESAALRSSDDLNLVIPQIQTFTASMFDKAADVMISEPVERATYSSDALEMGFARVGTIVRMTLKGLTSGETLKSVTFSTTQADKYLAGTVKYDLVNDKLKSGISSGKQALTLNAGESIVVPASGEVDVWFRTTEVTLSDNFTVVAYTRGSDSRNYSYTKVVDLASASKTLSLRSGRLATFGVTGLNSGKETLEYEALIPEGYYVLHVNNTASSYDKALANTNADGNNKYLDAFDNPFSLDGSGRYYVPSASLKYFWEVKFDNENNQYAFYSLDSGKYMNGDLTNSSSSAVYYYMGANSGDYSGTYSIYDGATFASAKHIGYNNPGSNPRFKFYAAPITNYPGYFTFTPAYTDPIVAYSNVSLASKAEISTPASILPTKLFFAETMDVEGVYSNAGCSVDADWIEADMADEDTGEIQYIVDENTDDSPRTAYVKVIALGENATETTVVFTITQPGAVGEDHTTTWTATSGALGSGIGSGTINTTTSGSGATQSWSYTRSLISGSSYTAFTSSCIQLGKDGGVENLTLTTSNIPGTIKSVSVECSSYKAKHNVAISVGGTSYLSSTATASWTTVSASSGEGTSSGTITISFTGGSRAMYIKSITVVYNN